MLTQTTARIHEHAGRVAIGLEGLPTFYLSTDLALQLSKELKIAATQIRNGYHYQSTGINREV